MRLDEIEANIPEVNHSYGDADVSLVMPPPPLPTDLFGEESHSNKEDSLY